MKSNLNLITPPSLPPLRVYAKLVAAADVSLMELYVRWLKLLALRGLRLKHLHDKTFNLLYRAVSRPWSEKRLLGKLQQEFIRRNLSLSLLLEPLDGFDWLSKNRYDLELVKASPILLQIIAPLSRFVAILNNQRPPFYQPFSNLILAYFILYVMRMPKIRQILQSSRLAADNKALEKQLRPLIDEAKEIIPVTNGLAFKFKVSFFLALCRRLVQKAEQNNDNKMNFFDNVNAFLYGLWYMLTTKNNSKRRNII